MFDVEIYDCSHLCLLFLALDLYYCFFCRSNAISLFQSLALLFARFISFQEPLRGYRGVLHAPILGVREGTVPLAFFRLQYALSMRTVLGDSMARRRGISSHVRVVPPRLDVAVLRPAVALRRAARLIEDRRRFHPVGRLRPALAFGMLRPKLVVRKAGPVKRSRLSSGLSHRLQFEVPHRVAVCARRKERREVLIANGAGGSRKPKRRSYWSDVSCRS